MIKDLEIWNFKCFKSLYLPELSRVNIIGGANNVGKTALLEAVFLFCDRRAPNLFLKHLGWRGVDLVRTDPQSMWGPYFPDFDLNKAIRIKVHRDGQEEQAEYRYNPNYRPKPKNGSQPPQAAVVSTQDAGTQGGIDITYEANGTRQSVHSYMDGSQPVLDAEGAIPECPRAGIIPARHAPPSEEDAGLLSQVKEAKRDARVMEFLRIMEPRLSDPQVSVAQPKPAIYCDLGLTRLLPLALAGDGLNRLLSMILRMILSADGGLVLIDEVENGVHYSVQERFWSSVAKAAAELKCQVIATTHSQECLRAAHAAIAGGLYEPEFRYIRLDRIGDETKAKTFNHEMLGVALQAGLEVR